jgi:hypothetical protein
MNVETTVPFSLPADEGVAEPALPQEVETPESEAQTEQPKPPKEDDSGPVKKRIDQLTWQRHEAERRLNAEIQKRAEAEANAQYVYQQYQEHMRRATMPTLDQAGMDPDAYQRQVQEHNERYFAEQRRVQEEAAQRQQITQAQAAFNQRLNARIAEGEQKFADYQDVIGNPSLPRLGDVNPAVLGALLEHENMPELTYYLGKNPAEAHRIAGLPPARALVELGRIAARLPANRPTKQNATPPPPAEVGGGDGGQKRMEDMSYDEFVKARRRQIAARR